jgi:RNA polymerase sigma factor (sigma-70 family)
MAPDSSDRLAQLMTRFQSGDGAAFEALYRLTTGSVEAYLRRFTRGGPVDDLAQETYLQVLRARRAYRPQVPFLPWLLAIARHVALRQRRTHARRWAREVASEAHMAAAVAPLPTDGASRLDLERALGELAPQEQELVWLAWVEGFTGAEIAAVTGLTAGAVKVRLHRLGKRLRGARPVARAQPAEASERLEGLEGSEGLERSKLLAPSAPSEPSEPREPTEASKPSQRLKPTAGSEPPEPWGAAGAAVARWRDADAAAKKEADTDG